MSSSYLPSEPITFINIKLTDLGRRMLSLGQLNFNTAVISDREVDYGVDRTNYYDISCCNRVLTPKDNAPNLPLFNLDGTPPVAVQSVGSALQFITAATPSTGFFSGDTNNWIVNTGQTVGWCTLPYQAYSPKGTQTILISGGTHTPLPGELIFIPWSPIQNSGVTAFNNGNIVLSANPTVNLWYRIQSVETVSVYKNLTLDRLTPDFGLFLNNQAVNAYFYPYNGIETYYGSGVTQQTGVWNMNIIRTSSVIGTDALLSGYTTYGSLAFNGTKQYLGFSSETRQIGIVHYTNNFSGNTYAEELLESTVVVDMPTIMWHNYPSNPGQGVAWGLELTDAAGPTIFDSVANTSYRPLRDGNSVTNMQVGRVYHKLGIIVITDPELLAALSYKSNRNYTMPPLTLGSSYVPQFPLTNTNATGLLTTGFTYFVSYVMTANTAYQSGVSFGYPQAQQCEYISSIQGINDNNGNPQFLTVKVNNGLPYMRNSANMDFYSSFSGSGWNANMFQIMVNKVDNTLYPNMQIDNLPTNGWQLLSNSAIGGNGVMSASTTIDPISLLTNTFIVSNEDYVSGSTYGIYTGETGNMDVTTSGLTFGNEAFFFGNITTGILATTYKSIITILAPNTSYNASINPSFDSLLDTQTYFTEFGILDNMNNLVALGKPTYPIPKDSTRFLTFQLEIDF